MGTVKKNGNMEEGMKITMNESFYMEKYIAEYASVG